MVMLLRPLHSSFPFRVFTRLLRSVFTCNIRIDNRIRFGEHKDGIDADGNRGHFAAGLGTNVKLPFLSVLGTDESGILADAQRLSYLPFYDVMVRFSDRLARVIEEMIIHQKILLVERQLV